MRKITTISEALTVLSRKDKIYNQLWSMLHDGRIEEHESIFQEIEQLSSDIDNTEDEIQIANLLIDIEAILNKVV